MDIRKRFSEESLLEIKKYLEENEDKSILLKATLDEEELIHNPFFLSIYKRKNFENILENI